MFPYCQEKGPEGLERQEGVGALPLQYVDPQQGPQTHAQKEGPIVDMSPSSPRVPSRPISNLYHHQMAESVLALC